MIDDPAPDYDDRADHYLEYKGDGVFRVNPNPSENHEVVLLVGELSVVIRPAPSTVLVDVHSYPRKGPVEVILHGLIFARYNPDDEGILDR